MGRGRRRTAQREHDGAGREGSIVGTGAVAARRECGGARHGGDGRKKERNKLNYFSHNKW
jgi:hypothetical protein